MNKKQEAAAEAGHEMGLAFAEKVRAMLSNKMQKISDDYKREAFITAFYQVV